MKIDISKLETTKRKACIKAGHKGKLLCHGANTYSMNNCPVKIWGYKEIGYTCEKELARELDLPMS